MKKITGDHSYPAKLVCGFWTANLFFYLTALRDRGSGIVMSECAAWLHDESEHWMRAEVNLFLTSTF